MNQKRNWAFDNNIRPSWNELKPSKHVKRERSKTEDTDYMKVPVYVSTLERLNRPVIEEGRIYPERLKGGTARILVLHPGPASDDIKCDLRQKEPLAQASFDKVLSYEALSYVWGKEEDPESIILCKCRFAVTRNLAEALKHLRLPNSDRMLWVDAICINQCDINEKEAQVGSMHWVYKLAEKVIAWLGPSDDDSSFAYEPMDLIQKRNITPVSPVIMTRISNEHARNEHDPFSKLMNRPYWSRAWVVQEMMFARSLVIQCGSEVVPYSSLEKVYPHNQQACIVIDSDKSGPKRIHFRGDHEVRILRLDYEQICPKQFLDCFLDRQCRERQDNIFAFLNLFSDDIQQRILVRYNTPLPELLLHTARAIIESTRSLYIIVVRGRQEPPCAQGNDKWQLEMPSWCPYWATPYRGYSVEPQDEPSLFAEKAVVSFLANGRLRVKGFVIGRISRTISRHTPPEAQATPWWDQADINREWEHYRECLSLGLNGMPKDIHTVLMSIKATTRTLLAGRGGNCIDEGLIQMLAESRTVDMGYPETIALREIWNNMRFRLACSFRLGRAATRALYSSKMAPAAWINRIALVPRTVLRGDAICAILGCSVAVVLRRRGERYHVLGEAYVDTSAMGPFKVAVGLRDFILG
ncbi:Heterokaryon incompatibility protein 6,OR allele [Lachnellula hyalina]|uniref:Heterokaryon incompatibility protein 6,OR allele n=1 Tax=Lachnellula hyalina TaxID=1316788 RepID=A0A8H8TVX6_9HELO|nr:Heterokaryon incompatibility protein 6,OR allele [Lachnellula hyalina]TVY23832.1 Heterokaryon incompatibility protein 6,OR allele [Lachnellula hyalina]